MSWILLCCSLLTAGAATAADARPTVVVVVGAEGEAEFGQTFAKAADRWADAAGRSSARVAQIGRDDATAGPPATSPATRPAASPATTQASTTRPAAATDRDRLRTLLESELKPAAPADSTRPLWLVLIGHGTFDGREAKFNLRGPDVSDQELAGWLAGCRRPLAVVNCASASAPFLNRLSGPNRVVVTATQSGHEHNYARFNEALAASVADPAADLDKDGQTSLLEAFLAASHRVEEFYNQGSRLATEHALLDDNGDALGTPAAWFRGLRATRAAKDGAPLDGYRAHQWHLVLSEGEQSLPAELRARRDEVELRIAGLRDRKASVPQGEYYVQLEGMLLELARLYDQSQPTTTTTPSPRPVSPPPAGERP